MTSCGRLFSTWLLAWRDNTIGANMTPFLMTAIARSRRLFPGEEARITIKRRSWISGLLISHAWSTEWSDAYRPR